MKQLAGNGEIVWLLRGLIEDGGCSQCGEGAERGHRSSPSLICCICLSASIANALSLTVRMENSGATWANTTWLVLPMEQTAESLPQGIGLQVLFLLLCASANQFAHIGCEC